MPIMYISYGRPPWTQVQRYRSALGKLPLSALIPTSLHPVVINVQCEKTILPISSHLQSVVDKPHIAAMYGRYVLDHAGQEFDGLWEIKVGDAVHIDGRQYVCTFITTGWSEMGIRADRGNLPNADLYLCTCVPGGRPYEIYIIGIDKE